jgi:hypothetical protein
MQRYCLLHSSYPSPHTNNMSHNRNDIKEGQEEAGAHHSLFQVMEAYTHLVTCRSAHTHTRTESKRYFTSIHVRFGIMQHHINPL